MASKIISLVDGGKQVVNTSSSFFLGISQEDLAKYLARKGEVEKSEEALIRIFELKGSLRNVHIAFMKLVPERYVPVVAQLSNERGTLTAWFDAGKERACYFEREGVDRPLVEIETTEGEAITLPRDLFKKIKEDISLKVL